MLVKHDVSRSAKLCTKSGTRTVTFAQHYFALRRDDAEQQDSRRASSATPFFVAALCAAL
jgi:hypothetical protein